MAAEEVPYTAELPARRALPVGIGVVESAALAGLVLWFAYDGGSYNVPSWTTTAIVVWWTIAFGIAIGIWPLERVGAPGRRVALLLTAFAVFTGISGFWSSGAEEPFQELNLALLYAGIVTLVAIASRRASAGRWCTGLAIGLVAVAGLALASRFFQSLFSTNNALLTLLPDAYTRLSYPVDYWNGLAILVALASPLLLRWAVEAPSPLARGLALAPFPVLATTIYLTSSRTGVATFVVGISVFLALTGKRWVAAGATILALGASFGAVAYTARQHVLLDGPLDAAGAAAQGHRVALVLVLLSALTAGVYAALCRLLAGFEPPAIAGRMMRYLLPVACLAALIAANPVERVRSFAHPPPALAESGYIQSHLLSTNGSWRWQLWQEAVDEFRTSPFIGRGAGSYEAWWSQHGHNIGFVGNPHSLYFDTLGDLGLVGLALLVTAFVTGAVVGIRRTRASPPALREGAAAVTAGFIAYAIAAGVDWMWELPVVSMIGMALLGLVIGPATDPEVEKGLRVPPLLPEPLTRRSAQARLDAERRRKRRRRGIRVAVVAFGIAALAAQVDLYAANSRITASQEAAARGDLAAAHAAADRARTLEPWAATPYFQLALVEERQGRLHLARRSIEQAIARDDDDWQLWLAATRLQYDLGDIRAARASLARLRELNPRSPIIALIDAASP